jgi:hypothetical protein
MAYKGDGGKILYIPDPGLRLYSVPLIAHKFPLIFCLVTALLTYLFVEQRRDAGYSRGSIPSGSRDFFFTSQRPDQVWGPPSLLFSEYEGVFPRSKAAGV